MGPDNAQLPMKLQAHLSNPRSSCAGNIPKTTAREVSHGVVELSMVEQIEEFGAKLKCHPLAYFCVLIKGNVPAIQSGTMEKPSVTIPKPAQWTRGKNRPVEKFVRFAAGAGEPRILRNQRSNKIWHVCIVRADQRTITGLVNGHWQTSRK